MARVILNKIRISTALLLGVFVGAIVACGGGSTDGGDSVSQHAGLGDQFVSDGGAGGRISITVNDDLVTGSTASFSVQVLDPDGQPLQFVRISCDSEKGIAIIEPSSSGVAFESTSARGVMSGTLGGLTPGSYLLQCSAPNGFGLTARKVIRVTGDVPEGFTGFPGAAGGNLGGGMIVDDTHNGTDDGGIRVSSIQYTDAGGTSVSGPIDTVQNSDCDGDVATNDPELFTDTSFTISMTNDTRQRISVDSVTFEIINSSGATVTTFDAIPTVVEIASGSSGDQVGLLITFTGGGSHIYNDGSNTAVSAGTFTVRATVAGEKQDGTAYSTTKSTSLTLRPVDNCGASGA